MDSGKQGNWLEVSWAIDLHHLCILTIIHTSIKYFQNDVL
jgi:hypothetical protein